MSKVLQFLVNTLYSIVYGLKAILLYRRNDLPDKAKLDQLVILGNGPSLKNDVSKLIEKRKAIDLMCVNYFNKSPLFTSLKPNYYVLADPNFEQAFPFFESLNTLCTWNMSLFVPRSMYNLVEKLIGQNQFISLYAYNKTKVIGHSTISHYFYKKDYGIPSAKNVLMPSIIIGMRLGYGKISILGADFSWLRNLYVDYNSNIILSDSHFYDSLSNNNRNLSEENKELQTKYSIRQQSENFAEMLTSFERLTDFAKKINCTLVNCSSETMIDTIPRDRF